MEDSIIRKYRDKEVKFAKEEFYDVPFNWTDEQIERHLLWLKPYNSGALIWCHYNEQLFDHPHICKADYIEEPIPSGMKRVRLAHQQRRYTKWNWFLFEDDVETAVTKGLRCCGVTNSPNFIWCWGDEELFKSDKTVRRVIRNEDLV